jgi:hypothetical protein
LDYGKTLNQSKVPYVHGCAGIPEIQRRRSNKQIFEGDAYAACSLLPFDSPGQLSDFESDGVNCHVTAQLLGKCSSAFTVSVASGTVYAE